MRKSDSYIPPLLVWILYMKTVDHVFLCSGLSPCQTTSPLCCLHAKIHKLQSHFFMQHFPHKLLQWHLLRILSPAPIHSFINGQLETSSSKTFPRSPWCLFNMLAVHWDEEAGLYYWLRSAPLACFLSSAATSLPFLRRAFRKIKIGTIKRKKFLKKPLKKWGVLVALKLDS